MSYSSQVTSVLPIQTGLTSNSFSPTFTFPAGSFTRSNFTVVFGISSLVVCGLSCADTPPVHPNDATTAVRIDTFKRFTNVPTRVLSKTVNNLLPRFRTVALTGLLATLAGSKSAQPQAEPKVAPATPTSDPAAAPLSRFEYSKINMGMRTRLVVYAIDETAAVNACR